MQYYKLIQPVSKCIHSDLADLEAMQKLLHLVVGICLRQFILSAAQSSSPGAQRCASNAIRLASAILTEAVNAGNEAGRNVVRMVIPPLLKPMLVDLLAKVRLLRLSMTIFIQAEIVTVIIDGAYHEFEYSSRVILFCFRVEESSYGHFICDSAFHAALFALISIAGIVGTGC